MNESASIIKQPHVPWVFLQMLRGVGVRHQGIPCRKAKSMEMREERGSGSCSFACRRSQSISLLSLKGLTQESSSSSTLGSSRRQERSKRRFRLSKAVRIRNDGPPVRWQRTKKRGGRRQSREGMARSRRVHSSYARALPAQLITAPISRTVLQRSESRCSCQSRSVLSQPKLSRNRGGARTFVK